MKGYYVVSGFKCFVHLSRFWIPLSLSWEQITLILSRARRLKWRVKSLSGAYATIVYIDPGDNMKRIVFQFYKTGILIQAKGFILRDVLDKLKLLLGRRIRANEVEVITVELYTLLRHPKGINSLKEFANFFDLELKEIIFSSGRKGIKKGYYIVLDGDNLGIPGVNIYLKARTHEPILPKTVDEPPYPDIQDKIEIVVQKKPFVQKLKDTFSKIIEKVRSIFRALLRLILGDEKHKIIRRSLYHAILEDLGEEDYIFLNNIPVGGWFKLSDIALPRQIKRRAAIKLVKMGLLRKVWYFYRFNEEYIHILKIAKYGKSFSDRAISSKEGKKNEIDNITRWLMFRLLSNLESKLRELRGSNEKNNNNIGPNRERGIKYINYLILGLRKILGLLHKTGQCLKSKCLKKVWNGTYNYPNGISQINNRDIQRDIPITTAYDLYLAFKRNPFLKRIYSKLYRRRRGK